MDTPELRFNLTQDPSIEEQSNPVQMGVYGYGGSNANSIWGVLYRSLIPVSEEERQKQKKEILNK